LTIARFANRPYVRMAQPRQSLLVGSVQVIQPSDKLAGQVDRSKGDSRKRWSGRNTYACAGVDSAKALWAEATSGYIPTRRLR